MKTAADDLVAWATKRADEVPVGAKRQPAAVYRRFFPAAEVFRSRGWSVPRMVEEFIAGGHWEKQKADALKQALARHFRNQGKREQGSRGGAEGAEGTGAGE